MSQGSANGGRGLRPVVLVANDQEWAARSFETILSGEGYDVVRAYTGRQVLERVQAHRLDAVILDAQMPDLDGASVCRMLREDPRIGPTMPILITTAGPSGRQERLAAYRSGAWEFFGYPFDPESVLLKLGMFLKAKRAGDAARDSTLVDEGTGFYNVQGLRRRCREMAAQAERSKEHLSCIVLRPEASARGSESNGELLAQRISEALRETVRSCDAIGRCGPLQFAVLSVSGDRDVAESFAARVIARASASGGAPLIVERRMWPFAPDEAFLADLQPSPEPVSPLGG